MPEFIVGVMGWSLGSSGVLDVKNINWQIKQNIKTCFSYNKNMHKNITLNHCPQCHCLLPPLNVPLTVVNIIIIIIKDIYIAQNCQGH